VALAIIVFLPSQSRCVYKGHGVHTQPLKTPESNLIDDVNTNPGTPINIYTCLCI